jgi:hypothetical protein
MTWLSGLIALLIILIIIDNLAGNGGKGKK